MDDRDEDDMPYANDIWCLTLEPNKLYKSILSDDLHITSVVLEIPAVTDLNKTKKNGIVQIQLIHDDQVLTVASLSAKHAVFQATLDLNFKLYDLVGFTTSGEPLTVTLLGSTYPRNARNSGSGCGAPHFISRKMASSSSSSGGSSDEEFSSKKRKLSEESSNEGGNKRKRKLSSDEESSGEEKKGRNESVSSTESSPIKKKGTKKQKLNNGGPVIVKNEEKINKQKVAERQGASNKNKNKKQKGKDGSLTIVGKKVKLHSAENSTKPLNDKKKKPSDEKSSEIQNENQTKKKKKKKKKKNKKNNLSNDNNDSMNGYLENNIATNPTNKIEFGKGKQNLKSPDKKMKKEQSGSPAKKEQTGSPGKKEQSGSPGKKEQNGSPGKKKKKEVIRAAASPVKLDNLASPTNLKSSNKIKDDFTSPKLKNSPNQSPNKESVLKGGIIAKDLKLGSGNEVKKGNMATIFFEAKLQSTGDVFESNTTKAPTRFRVGSNEVIKGLEYGVRGMRVGGKRRLTVPPKMGYGNKQNKVGVPPKETLVYDVIVVSSS